MSQAWCAINASMLGRTTIRDMEPSVWHTEQLDGDEPAKSPCLHLQAVYGAGGFMFYGCMAELYLEGSIASAW